MLDEALKKTFSLLNGAGVDYVVLRNYAPLENLNSQGDIDLLVCSRGMPKLKEILLGDNWLPKTNWAAGRLEVFKLGKEGKMYQIDAQDNLLFGKERVIIGKPRAVLANKKLLGGSVFVPNEIDSLILYLFRLALEKDKISEKQFAQAKYLRDWAREGGDFNGAIEKKFGLPVSDSLLTMLKDESGILNEENYKILAKTAKEKFPRQTLCLWEKMKNFAGFWSFLFYRPKLIVFVGVDGSGKTTLIGKLKDYSPAFKTQVYFGWKDYFFKFLARLEQKSSFSNETLRKISNRLKFFLFHLLLPFDLFVRYLGAKKRAEYGIILADRFPLPKKYSGNSRLPIQKIYRQLSLRLAYLLLPRPALLFILIGDPQKLWERKREGSFNRLLDEIERSKNAFGLFGCRAQIIKTTDGPVEYSFNQILGHIFDYFNNGK